MVGFHSYSRMKLQSDAEQTVKSMCAPEMTVQREPVKSHTTQEHVERAVQLVANRCRAVLSDVQERTRVEVDPTSAASPLRRSVWLLNRSQRHRGRATSSERLERPKQRRVLEDPDGDGVMIGEIQVNEEVQRLWSEISPTDFDDWQ